MNHIFTISGVALFLAVGLHSCSYGPKKYQLTPGEQALLGTWEYESYRVNGEDWNDTAAKYGFNYPINFKIVIHDRYEDRVDSRRITIMRKNTVYSDTSCLSTNAFWEQTNNSLIVLMRLKQVAEVDTTTNIGCKLSDEEFMLKLPSLRNYSQVWNWSVSENYLKLTTNYNNNFYEWTLKK